ncbi:MAG: T9SS type A sorting domain-containing protein [Algoriphagus sp.]|uniref:glycine-rich domain-containing protein n=1 Tax=Algoriphagus sp. TaxID=1872435 RepID=UPI00272F1963|nr:T9SS type A sorting domain-containing protein [Algoriphagus sp.]MDP2042768.1 T9SS type A sorting domain-containing protein [Algoriphagus sp.]MDP3472166.1 T9SS type A sorting domain-containing protein [Algoriphagus sp.]
MWPRPLPEFFIRKPIALLGFLGLMVWSVLLVFKNQTFFFKNSALKKFLPIPLVFIFLIFFGGDAFGQCPAPITITGGSSWSVPAGVTSITVEVWGAGGAGGRAEGNPSAGGGGSGGGYVRTTLNVTPGSSINYFVGAGGSGTTGANGQSSWFQSNTTLLAVGGLGAGIISTNTFGAGASKVSTGNIGGTLASFYGGSGGNAGDHFSGGGGGSAGTVSDGNNASGSAGSTAVTGGSAGPNGITSGNNPGITAPFGSGGSGGRAGNPTDQNGGNGGNGQIVISINPSAVGAISANQTICSGSSPSNITIANATGTIQWQRAENLAFTTNVTNIGTNSLTLTSAQVGALTATRYFRAVVTNGTCTPVNSGIITVTVDNPTATAGPSLAAICQGQTSTAMGGSVGGGVTGGTWSGGAGTWTNATNPSTATYTAGANESGTITLTLTTSGGSCGTTTATKTITVNPNPTATAGPASAAICQGQTSTAMGGSVGGGATGGTWSGGSGSWTNPTNPATATYTAGPTESGTITLTLTTNGGSCGTTTATKTITVNPNPTATAGPALAAICQGQTSPAMGGSVGGGATGGTWSGGAGTWTNATNPATATYTSAPTESGIITLTLTTNGGSCGTTSVTKTITINATAAINSPSLAAQTRCQNVAFSPISVAPGQGLTYLWYSNAANNNSTGSAITGATSNTYTPPSSTVGTTYYYVVVTSATCGTTATSAVSGAFLVNQPPTVTFDPSQPSGTHCVDTDLTYTTQSGQTNYVWTIPGVAGADYTIVSGGNSSSNTAVIRWLTAGPKSITVSYTDPNNCGATTPATSNTITVLKNTVQPPSNPNPSACNPVIGGGVFPTITHGTVGALGIGIPVGLPLGLTAAWSGTAANGTITISGTVDSSVTPGPKAYSIPLTGGCGIVSATGIIDVQPEYTLTDISSVSPSNLGGAATITLTVSPAALTNGSYVVNYQRGLANPLTATDIAVNFVNGVGVFSSPGINNEDLTSLTVNSIRKLTDPTSCPVPLTSNNVTFFGIQPKIYPSNGTFYVPAGIFQITVKVYGGGGGGGGGSNPNSAGGGGGGYSEQTFNVVPGEAIGIFVGSGGTGQIAPGTPAGNGGPSWVTRDSSHPNPQTSSIAYAFGGGGANGATPGAAALAGLNGSINQSGNIGALPNTTAADTGGRGGKGGGPDGGNGGLGGAGTGNRPGNPGVPFGGGGGGAKGNANGGNGAGGYVIITYPLPPVSPCFRVIDDGSISGTTIIEFTCDTNTTWTAPEGLVEFYTVVGGGGGGGGAGDGAGGGGAGGLVTGNVQSGNPFGFPANTSFTIRAGDGGSGATSNGTRGSTGNPSSLTGPPTYPVTFTAGGGGGGGSQSNIIGGSGSNGASGGGGGANNTAEGTGGTGSGTGKAGGLGDFSTDQAFAGGGGGGIAELGGEGKAAGLGQGEGGKGGNGVSIIMGDSIRYFGAGGGGVGFNFNGTKKIGFGGTAPNGSKIGGDGNITGTNPVGLSGINKTGSGGGAGNSSGGRGGNGVVYIYYFNIRILGVEYLYFNTSYRADTRSGELKWATSQEWENSHFEIERAVNDVRTWTKVGEVQGAGYSDTTVYYEFTDTELPATGGNIFYRLKQVDMKGDFSYSLTRSIQVNPIKGNTAWIGYPNPSDLKAPVTVAMIDNTGYTDGTIQVRISDIRGVFSSYSVSSPDAVSNVVNSHLENARPGMYIVQLLWGSQSEQLKLIKK